MEDFVEVPQELKDAVNQRFKAVSAPKLGQKIKVGMAAAIHELRYQKPASSLEYHPLKEEGSEEVKALQSIYQYLEAKGLKWTLGCLIQESAIDKSPNPIDFKELLKREISVDDGEEDGDLEL
jgi:hypothetical protein